MRNEEFKGRAVVVRRKHFEAVFDQFNEDLMDVLSEHWQKYFHHLEHAAFYRDVRGFAVVGNILLDKHFQFDSNNY